MFLNRLVFAVLMLLALPASAQHVLGLHTVTYHSANIDCDNGNNPGLYYGNTDSGLVLGTYYNSCRKQSYYVGYITPDWRGLSVVADLVTGYVLPVTPRIYPSLAMGPFRLSGGKWGPYEVVHLSMEVRF